MSELMRMGVTSLDSWIRFQTVESYSAAEFIADLRRERPPNIAMRRGTAFHLMMEAIGQRAAGEDETIAAVQLPPIGNDGDLLPADEAVYVTLGDGAEAEHFSFTFAEGMQVPIHVDGEREVWGQHIYDDLAVRLGGKADFLGPRIIVDYKTGNRDFDPEFYFGMMQWRCYLMLYERDHFHYDWFRLKPAKRGEQHHMTITDHAPLDMFRYPGMEDDVRSTVVQLHDFRVMHGIP